MVPSSRRARNVYMVLLGFVRWDVLQHFYFLFQIVFQFLNSMIIFPLSTALAVSQRSVEDISRESFVSMKDVHAFERSVKVIAAEKY